MNKKLTALSLILIFCLFSELCAQVTIGSSNPPSPGALLQLQNKTNGNSDKGLSLPRVSLTDHENLYPMFKGDLSYTGAEKINQDKLHTGLVVYNTAISEHLCLGMAVWEGKRWMNVTDNKCFYIDIAQDEVRYDVNDNPTTTEYIDLSWAPENSTVTLIHEAIKGEGLRNITFPKTITDPTGMKNVAITAKSMTNAEISTNPVIDRESKITAKVTVNTTTKETSVLLKQQHAGLIALPEKVYMMDGLRKKMIVKSSGRWTVKIKDNPGNAFSLVTTSGESNLTGEDFLFDLVNDMTNPSIYLSKVKLTFSSPDNLFADVDVELRCGSYYYVPETKILVKWTDEASKKSLPEAKYSCALHGMRIPSVLELQSMVRYFSAGEGMSSDLTGFWASVSTPFYWTPDIRQEWVNGGTESGGELANVYKLVNIWNGTTIETTAPNYTGVRCVKPHPNPPAR